jgi:hypothetical protein
MMFAGLSVFHPLTEDTSVDLLVLRADGVALKCQCKAMFVDGRSDVHVMPLCSVRKWGPGTKAVVHRYRRDEVDFFLGYALENDSIYVFPFDATARFKSKLSVWILREPTNRNGSPRFDATSYKNAFHLLA